MSWQHYQCNIQIVWYNSSNYLRHIQKICKRKTSGAMSRRCETIFSPKLFMLSLPMYWFIMMPGNHHVINLVLLRRQSVNIDGTSFVVVENMEGTSIICFKEWWVLQDSKGISYDNKLPPKHAPHEASRVCRSLPQVWFTPWVPREKYLFPCPLKILIIFIYCCTMLYIDIKSCNKQGFPLVIMD